MDDRDALLQIKQCLGCTHEGLLVTTLDGTILESTPGAEHILETPALDIQGRHLHEFCNVRNAYDDLCVQVKEHGKVLNRALILSTGTGKRKIVNMSIQRSGDGVESGRLVHVFQDCADLRTLEEKLLQSERLATVGRFASQIAHEIRNPLNSISLNVELLEEQLNGSNEEARHLIQSVMRELDRLNDIVGEYLQFARFPKVHLKRGSVEGVIRQMSAAFKRPARIEFKINLASVTPQVWIDEGLLRQVLDNLIRNAAEAIEGDGTIELETDVLDRFLVIRVKDTGIGIPLDAREKLFEPFFTTKPHGTGLGLATSQQIIFEHNGHLLVDSQPGKGSTFSIMLPL